MNILIRVITVLCTASFAFGQVAEVPRQFNYQGRVAVQGVNFTGTGQFKFALVGAEENASQQATAFPVTGSLGDGMGPRVISITILNGGAGYTDAPAVTITHPTGMGAAATAVITGGVVTAINVTENGLGYDGPPTNTLVTIAPPPANLQRPTRWSNDGTSTMGSEPADAVALTVTGGLYSAALGDTTVPNMAMIPENLFARHGELYLRVWFDDGVRGSQLLTPDQRIRSAPYAMVAGTVPDGSIYGNKIAEGAVGTSQLAPGAVDGDKIANSAISPLMLAASEPPSAGQVLGFNGSNFIWSNIAGGGITLPFSDTINSVAPAFEITNSGVGVRAVSGQNDGLSGRTDGVFKSGVFGHATGADSTGVHGASDLHHGVYAYTGSADRAAIWANAPNGAEAIHGHSEFGDGIVGYTAGTGNSGVLGFTAAVDASGVHGSSTQHHGVYAHTGSSSRAAIWANAPNGAEAVHAHSDGGDGVVGYTGASAKAGVFGFSPAGNGIAGTTGGADKSGVFGSANRADNYGGFFFNSGGGYALRTVGKAIVSGNLTVQGTATVRVLTIDGGVDLAEPFVMRDDAEFPPGSVMVISDERVGELQLSSREYDTRVAGIISGANGINPGIQLTQKGVNDAGGQPVALTGRVYCRADATNGAIKPGDLLTTSSIPGHAMKANDHTRTQGAVLGKAMSALDEGTGFVLVLVTLQ